MQFYDNLLGVDQQNHFMGLSVASVLLMTFPMMQ